jgi:hypothetical protein
VARLYQLARIQGMNGELGAPGHPRSGASQLVRHGWRDLGHVYMLVTGPHGRLRIPAGHLGSIRRLVDGLVVVLLRTPRKSQDLGRYDQCGSVFPSGDLPSYIGSSAVASAVWIRWTAGPALLVRPTC